MSCFSIAYFTLTFVGICVADPSIIPVGGPLLVSHEQLLTYKPYEFGFEFGNDLGMHRKKVGDASGAVKGSYGYVDLLGVNRDVEYTADGGGYNALVRSNELGSVRHKAAQAVYLVQAPPLAAIAKGLKAIVSK